MIEESAEMVSKFVGYFIFCFLPLIVKSLLDSDFLSVFILDQNFLGSVFFNLSIARYFFLISSFFAFFTTFLKILWARRYLLWITPPSLGKFLSLHVLKCFVSSCFAFVSSGIHQDLENFFLDSGKEISAAVNALLTILVISRMCVSSYES